MSKADGWHYDPTTCTFALYFHGEVLLSLTEEIVQAAADDTVVEAALRKRLFGTVRVVNHWPQRLLSRRPKAN